MKIVDTVFSGNIRMRLIERRGPAYDRMAASGFYFDVKDERTPHFGFCYLDSDPEAAKIMFRNRVDTVVARQKVIDHAGQ